MLRELLDRWRERRAARLAHDYGSMTEQERIELERVRDDLGALRNRGTEQRAGREFDRELDAEEGRPRY